ncbi:MAG: Sec-independent protein translocase subunit TatA [Umezawaea sp.]
MGNLGATELLIIALVVILLFGSKKLPEMARSLGRSAKILKAETSGMQRDDDGPTQPAQATASVLDAPAAVEHNSEADQIQKRIEDLQRQLMIAQQAQSPRNAG